MAVGAFESEALALFHSSMSKANSAAIQEAAITNGILQEITSIKVSIDHINFIGKVSRGHFFPKMTNIVSEDAPYIILQVDSIGNYHSTWINILDHYLPLGYLIFMFPVKVIYEGKKSSINYDINENIIINVQLNKIGNSLNQRIIGEILCANCGKQINPKRLIAVPNTLYCTECMIMMENGGGGYGKFH
jgi:hypothetical protein